jgi:hypothetical protein
VDAIVVSIGNVEISTLIKGNALRIVESCCRCPAAGSNNLTGTTLSQCDYSERREKAGVLPTLSASWSSRFRALDVQNKSLEESIKQVKQQALPRT